VPQEGGGGLGEVAELSDQAAIQFAVILACTAVVISPLGWLETPELGKRGWSHATRDVAWEADHASVQRGGEGPRGADGVPAAQGAGTEHGTVKRVAEQLGIGVESLRGWVKQREVDDGLKPGTTSADAARIAQLEQEVRELLGR
jgi:hypothetical protein